MVVGYIKMNSSKKIHNEVAQGKVWQRSYHDHIIRGEEDYRKYGSILTQTLQGGRTIAFILNIKNKDLIPNWKFAFRDEV